MLFISIITHLKAFNLKKMLLLFKKHSPFTFLEATPGFEPGVKDLQSSALPLGYVASWSGRRDLNSRLSPWQGDTLPLSYTRNILNGALGRNRTTDTRIFSPLLYRLSYQGRNGDPERARTVDLQRDRLAF